MNQIFVENVLEAAFSLQDYPQGGQLDALCEGCSDATMRAASFAGEIATERDRLAAMCTELALIRNPEHANAVRVLLAVFRPILVQLQQACDALGVK